MAELVEEAKEQGYGKDPVVRDRIAQLLIESQVLRLNAYRGITGQMKRGFPGPEGSLGKWHWAEINQSLTELALDIRGRPRWRRIGRRPVGLPLPAREGQLDRGRDDRDPQEHRRRARPGTAPSMNFDLYDDQRDIQRSAKEMLAARYKLEEVRRLALEEERGFTDAQWQEMADLGWPDLLDDLGMVELAVIAEELGYALAPTPLQSHWTAKMVGRLRGPRHGRLRSRRLAGSSRTSTPPTSSSSAASASTPSPTASASMRSTPPGRSSASRPTARDAAARRPPARPARRRERRHRAARDGDVRRLRHRAQAVRPPDRHQPGRLAPLRADAARGRGRPRARLQRRLGARARPAAGAAGRRDGQGLGVRRRPARRLRPRSRSTAASASPGSTTCTSSSSAPRPTPSRSAARASSAPASPSSSSTSSAR